MKNYLRKFSVTVLISMAATFSVAQTNVGIPDIEQVINSFFSTYTWKPNGEYYLQFEKRDNGWWISEMGYQPGSPKTPGKIFWNKRTNSFESLHYDKRTNNHIDSIKEDMAVASGFLNIDEPTIYNYRRNLYYGYEGWDWDVITALKDRTALTDTLQESLARAASSYAVNYFYNQWGYADTKNDSDRTTLKDTDPISLSRVKKFMQYEDLSIAIYRNLVKSNPAYQTLVGDIKTKANNEQMFAFSTLKFLGYDTQAAGYLKGISFADSVIQRTKNMLNEIKPNSIFITSGDNITYPVWFLQEQGFRTDVITIDYNLLGLRRFLTYVDRRYNKSVLGTDSSIYMNPLFDYSRFEAEYAEDVEIPLDSFITRLYKSPQITTLTRGNRTIYYTVNPEFKFFTKRISLPVNPGIARKLYGPGRFRSVLPFPITRDYLLANEMLQLSIINKNFLKKRIYFSFPSDTDATHEGVVQHKYVWELTPEIK